MHKKRMTYQLDSGHLKEMINPICRYCKESLSVGQIILTQHRICSKNTKQSGKTSHYHKTCADSLGIWDSAT